MSLSVQPTVQTPCFKARALKVKKVKPQENTVSQYQKAENLISVVAWLGMGIALLGGAIFAVADSIKKFSNSKEPVENTESVSFPRENTADYI